MAKPKRNGTAKIVYLLPVHTDMAERFIVEKGVSSFTEVVRQAITYFYEGKFPAYLEETSRGKDREKKQKQEDDFATTSPEDFARDTLKGVVVVDKNGTKKVLLHTIANLLMPVPLEGIKDWAKDHNSDMKHHFNVNQEKRTVEEAMLSGGVMHQLFSEHGIVLPQ